MTDDCPKSSSWLNTSNLIALASAAISVFAAVASIYANYLGQNRQFAFEQISRIDQSFTTISDAFGDFTEALASGDNNKIQSAKIKIRAAALKSSEIASHASSIVKIRREIVNYQAAISDFVKTSSSIDGAKDYRLLAESYGRVNDTREAIKSKV